MDLTQALRTNDFWHTANLDMLDRCVKYVQGDNFYAYVALWECYRRNECERLRERAALMSRYQIENLPHKHEEREKQLIEKLIALLAIRMEGVIL